MVEKTWTDDLESFLNDIRINSIKLSEFHRRNYIGLRNKIKYFRVPTLILSSLNSVFSVGLSAFVPQPTVSVLNCLISLVCGIIVSIELFLQIQSKIDSSLSLSKEYYILHIDIYKTLSLDRDNRRCDPYAYMEERFAEYSKFKDSSDLLNVHLHDQLETIPLNKYKLVYSPPPDPPGPPGPNPNPSPDYLKRSETLCAVDIDYMEFGENNSLASDKQETPLSVVDVLPEIETRAARSLSVNTTRTPTPSRNNSRRPSLETVSIAVRDIETGEIVG